MIKITSLSKKYINDDGSILEVLKNINLTLPNRGFISILGKSGSGKSTLLSIIAAFQRPDEGDVFLCGNPIFELDDKQLCAYRRNYFGFVFQEYNLIEEFTVKENIELSCTKNEDKDRLRDIKKALDKVGLSGYLHRKVNTLSGGQKQRVALARALVKDAPFIIADEPTAFLDDSTANSIFKLLRELSVDRLVFIATHDIDKAREYCDRIIEIENGAIKTDKFRKHEYYKPTILSDNIYISDYHLNSNDAELVKDAIHSAKSKISVQYLQVFDDYKCESEEAIRSLNSENYSLTLKSTFKLAKNFGRKHYNRTLVTTLLMIFSFFCCSFSLSLCSYNHNEGIVNEIASLNQNYISYFYNSSNASSIDVDLAYKINNEFLNIETGLNFQLAYQINDYVDFNQYLLNKNNKDNLFYTKTISAVFEYDEYFKNTANLHYLAGNMPKNDDEVVITKQHYDTFKIYGYSYLDTIISPDELTYDLLIGKTIGNNLTISGIVDTNLNLTRYYPLNTNDEVNANLSYLSNEFELLKIYSYHYGIFLNSNTFERLSAEPKNGFISSAYCSSSDYLSIKKCVVVDSFNISNENLVNISNVTVGALARENLKDFFSFLINISIVFLFLFLIFTFVLLYNITKLSLSINYKYIGILKSLGFENRTIISIFSLEIMSICLFAIPFSYALTLLAIFGLNCFCSLFLGFLANILSYQLWILLVMFIIAFLISLFISLLCFKKVKTSDLRFLLKLS